jgi:tellurite resistance protein TerC
VRTDGLWSTTPLFLALVLVESADLVFAIDSIPAIFAITTDPFIVYSSNVFAILGLRALYFALAAVIHRFHYLKYGLSLVLVAIGGKMLANGIAGAPVVPTEFALTLMAVFIGGAIGLSLLRPPRKDEPPAGWIPGSRQPQQDETLTVKEIKR